MRIGQARNVRETAQAATVHRGGAGGGASLLEQLDRVQSEQRELHARWRPLLLADTRVPAGAPLGVLQSVEKFVDGTFRLSFYTDEALLQVSQARF